MSKRARIILINCIASIIILISLLFKSITWFIVGVLFAYVFQYAANKYWNR